MTTRNDLVSELRKIEARLMASNETKADAWDIGLAIEQLTASASALESKDAEIARLTTANSELDEKWRYWQSRADTKESRISSLERQLAEETERCAQMAEFGRDHMLRTAQRDEVKHVKHAVEAATIAAGALDEIAAAIRGGAK